MKCNPINCKTCPQDILDMCITGVQHIDNTEWVYMTCNGKLKDGKLQSCLKANKMSSPDKPQVLDLTPLEGRPFSLRIPSMQICELPRGGQSSIHVNVVNVLAIVNSTVKLMFYQGPLMSHRLSQSN